jgi:long-chain acyl-CoA synthetase
MQSTMMLLQQLRRTIADFPDRIAFVEGERMTSYRMLGDQMLRVAYFLRPQISAGDRVALLLENSAEYAAACYGVWLAGGVVVGLNTALKARDLVNLITHCEARWLVADSANRELTAIAQSCGCHLIITGDAMVAAGDAVVTARDAAAPGIVRWTDLQSVAQDLTVEPMVPPDQLAAIIYTSGTTGNPKGVVLSHANLAANIGSIRQYLPIRADDRMLCVLPFYYSYGNSVLHSHLSCGATLILENSLMYPHKVLARMAEQKATAFAGVPSTFYLLLARTKLAAFDLSSLRYCTQAGGGMDAAKITLWRDVLPQAQFFVMYGQTEAAARLTYLPPAQLAGKAGSVGVAIPGVELTVRNEHDVEVGVGIIGEICARGDNVMRGYWRDEQETAAVLRNGWLHTGDVGYRDADGFFFLVGRNKEMIKTGAHRVSPREIEELVAGVDGVEEVAVVGMADDVMGQVIKACVVAADGDHEAHYQEELRKKILRLCREQLAIYKMPKVVAFYQSFPKTASGKIQKHLIE